MKTRIVTLAAAVLLAGSSFAMAQTAGNNAGVGAPGTTPGQETKNPADYNSATSTDRAKSDQMKRGTTGQSAPPSQTNGSGNIGNGNNTGNTAPK